METLYISPHLTQLSRKQLLAFAVGGMASLTMPSRADAAITITNGNPTEKSQAPFGSVNAFTMKVIHRDNIAQALSKFKMKSGQLLFIGPRSGDGFGQIVHSARVLVDGEPVAVDYDMDWLKRPVYHVDVGKDSKEFYAEFKLTTFNRVIRAGMRNPKAVNLSDEERKKTLIDYSYARGGEKGVNRPTLQAMGLLKKEGESCLDYAGRLMIDGKNAGNTKYRPTTFGLKARWSGLRG